MDNTGIKLYRTNSGKMESVLDEWNKEKETAPVIHLHDKNEDNLYIGDCRMTDNFNIGDVNEDSVTSLDGKTLGELKDKTMSEIVMDIICPVVNPTHTDPSVTILYSGPILIDVGDTLPVKDDMTYVVSCGVWSDGSAYYGSCSGVEYSMNPDKWGGVCDEGKYEISGEGTFTAGEMSKNSRGIDYEQVSGGLVESNVVTITAVYPIQINDNDISVMSDYLVDYNSLQTIHVEVPAETDDIQNKFRVYLPSAFSIFEVNQYNPLTDKYDIAVKMNLLDGEISKYIRTNGVYDTKTDNVKYEIKLKK